MPHGVYRIGSPTGGSGQTSSVTVGTGATKIPTSNMKDRKAVAFWNMSTNASDIVYIGNSDVTVNTGYPIYPSSSLPLECSMKLQWYGIVAAGTVEVRTLEVSNE